METSSLMSSPLQHDEHKDDANFLSDSSSFLKQANIPKQFIWPECDLIQAEEELNEPVVDLEGFFKGDEVATNNAVKQVRDACLSHGFFQVINHGVDLNLISMAHDHMLDFFKSPIAKKLKVQKQPGTPWGYSSAHAERFASKLPWKETLSFGFHDNDSDLVVEEFFRSSLGVEFEKTGLVYQKYCESMKKLSLAILEILGLSLGVDRSHYKDFFEDGTSIMRCNHYPKCQEPSFTLGTGPHCDPNSLTILYQDDVGGLEVFIDGKWKSVGPRPDALVINIGDTFTALSNGRYVSCLHRAVVNQYRGRVTLAFFLCPREDKVIKPPDCLVQKDVPKMYPDFTWSDFLKFTHKHYRVDGDTLQNFSQWVLSSGDA